MAKLSKEEREHLLAQRAAHNAPESETEKTRGRLIQAMHQGDRTAIHALHDWHEENRGTNFPKSEAASGVGGLRQEAELVSKLREYVDNPHKNRGYVPPEEDYETHTPEQRVRSAAEHITGSPVYSHNEHGSLVSMKRGDRKVSGVLRPDPPDPSFNRYVSRGNSVHAVDRSGRASRHWAGHGDVENHASVWLREQEAADRGSSGAKSLDDQWDEMGGR